MGCKPQHFRPIGEFITVKVDAAPTSHGPIIIPEGRLEDDKAMATVIRVGTGVWTRKGKHVPIDLQPGDRVTIVRMHELTDTQKQVQAELGKGFLILRCNQLADDVIAVEVPSKEDADKWRKANLEKALAKEAE